MFLDKRVSEPLQTVGTAASSLVIVSVDIATAVQRTYCPSGCASTIRQATPIVALAFTVVAVFNCTVRKLASY